KPGEVVTGIVGVEDIEALPGCGVPEHHAVAAHGSQQPAVGTEGNPVDGTDTRENAQAPARCNVPERNGPVVASGGKDPAVRVESDAVDDAAVTAQVCPQVPGPLETAEERGPRVGTAGETAAFEAEQER